MKKSMTRIIAMLLVVALCCSLLPMTAAAETQTATFKDVGPNHWAYTYVEQAVADGLFVGINDESFAPDMTMDRAMFVTVLSRLAGVTTDNNVKTGFTDVPTGAYYTGAVAWAVEQGIAAGTTATTFSPKSGVTREQAATFLYRYAQGAGLVLAEGEAREFTDEADISAYAKEAVTALTAAGVISGYGDGSFKPNNILTRAEAAVLLVRFSQLTAAPKETYAVTFMAPHVTVLVDGSETTFCAVEEGSSLTFTLEAEEGYAITGVSTSEEVLTANDDGTYTLTNITGDTTVTVVAEATAPETYLVQFAAENALVYVDGQAVTEALAAGELTFSVEAAEGYEIFSVTADAGTLTENDDGTYTLTGITSAATVYVTAIEQTAPPAPETYTITFVTDDGVAVYVDGVEAETATVSSDDLPFSFGVSLVEDHTQIASTEVSPAGSLYFTGAAYVLTGITGNTTVTLTTGPEMLNVSFYTPEGATPVETVQVAYGQLLELPEDPTMEGYFFGGWYTEKDLFYDFLPETPITEDMILYGGFGKVVDTVHFDSLTGSNMNDGATKETSVISMSWALKLAEHSTTKSIIMHYAAPVLTNVNEVWDASHIEGGITVYMDPDTYTEQGTWAIFATNGHLTVNNLHFVCEGATEFKGACFLYNYSAYDSEAEKYTYGNTTLINCTVTGFGNMPAGEPGFFNDTIYNLGTLTMIGGEYYGNHACSGGVVNNYHGYSNFYADGVYFHDNRAPYSSIAVYPTTGQGGALWINCWVAEVKNCVFENNWAEVGGGAIAAATLDNLVLENCTFKNNSTDGSGGAVYSASSTKLTLNEGNSFTGNSAYSTGGAIYYAADITLTQGVFKDNSASRASDVYTSKSLTIAPTEGTDLSLPGGVTAGQNLYVSASLKNMAENLVVQPLSVAAGTTIATGQNYTLTEDDLARITVRPSAELVLDTDRNIIKVKEVVSGGDEGGTTGPVEEEMDGPHNLSVVYLGGTSDSNDGKSQGTAVATFGKAKSLLAKDGIIYICGRIDISGDKMWSLDPEKFGSAKVMRDSSYTGWCVVVHGSLTLHDIVIDGGNIDATTAFLGTNGTYKGNSITVGEGAVIQNCRNTSSYASAINASGTGDTIEIAGGTISNCYSGGSNGGAVRAENVILKSGTIENCTGKGNYGGAAICGKNVTVSGGVIKGCTNTQSYASVIFMQSSGMFTMSGGTITNCTGRFIIGHQGNTSIDISGGEICNNTPSYGTIGAPYSGGSILMTGGKIYNNTASSYSGGIYVPSSATFTMNGGEITGNSGGSGGGVYLGTSGSVVLKSGTISGNQASTGDEMYIGMQKLLTISPNSNGLEIGGEIYLRNSGSYFASDGNYIGDLTNLKGTLKFNYYSVKAGVVVGTPADGYTITEADLAKFDSYGCNMGYEIDANGKVITKAIPLESVTLDKTELTVMATYTDTLKASVGPETASSLNLTWSSSNTAVAKVSGNLLEATVTGVAPGTATITATAADGSGIKAECVVTVTENTTPVATLSLNKTEHAMRVEQSVSLTASITPSNAANQTLNWTVSDPEKVSLTGSGKTVTLKALAPGEVTVTAATTDGTNLTASCVLTIDPRIEIESITLDKNEYRMDDGESVSLTATVNPTDAWNTNVTWTSSNKDVAVVEGSSKTVTVKALADGTATITATTADGKTASCVITVADFPVTGFAIEAASDTVEVSDTVSLTAKLEPANAANKTVTWTSSDETIATVHTYGSNAVVYGVAPGTVTVTATTADGGFTDEVTITVKALTSNTMTLDLTSLDLIVHQSFNITALFEKTGLDVTWTSSNTDAVDILTTTSNQVTIKCGGAAGSAVITATASDGQTATCTVNVKGRVSGTMDEVYVSDTGNDANNGATSETAVRSFAKAVELLGVDGTIYVEGRYLNLGANPNVTLPREIYGDAKIVMVHTHEEVIEEYPWGPEINEECYSPYFLFSGNVQLSDVTISWEDGGNASNIFGTGTSTVVISNGAKLLGCGAAVGDSQTLGYFYTSSRLVINGGEIAGFGGSQVIWSRQNASVQVNGGYFHDNFATRVFNTTDTAPVEINGGTFVDNKAIFYGSYTIGLTSINGGTFINHSTAAVSSSNCLAYLYNSDIEIDVKYDMSIENYSVFSSTRYEEINVGRLHKLQGTLNVYTTSNVAVPGYAVCYGGSRDLTWEELAKVSMDGKTLALDMAGNRIYIQ